MKEDDAADKIVGGQDDRGAEQGRPAGRSGRVVAIDDPGVRLVPEGGELAIELVGELAEILALTNEISPRPWGPGAGQLTLVAGAGFEPAAFRL